MQIFKEVLFFKLRTTTKTEKQKMSSTYLVSVGCGRLAEGKGQETDHKSVSCPIPSASLSHPTDTRKVESVVSFSVEGSLKKRTSLKICTFCPVSCS